MRAALAIATTAALLLGTIWLLNQDLAPLPPDLPRPTQRMGEPASGH